jgi:hypothetical protein
MLTVSSSDLDEVLVSNSLELIFVLRKLRELDVNGSSQSSSKVSWARCDVTEVGIVRKLANCFDVSYDSAKSIEDLEDTSSFLHRDNSQLIFFVNPHEESLGIIVENTSSRWPISVHVACFQKSISLPKFSKKLSEID